MAFVIDDRVRETSTTTGTGTYTLAGAVTGYQSFGAIGDGNTTWYGASDGVNWEFGVGTYTAAGTTLARTTVFSSSNADAAVNWGAGTKTLVCTFPASKIVGKDIANIFTGSNSFSAAFSLTGAITPAQITSDQNNYAPTGFSTCSVVRVSADTYRVITGLAGGSDGRLVALVNVGSNFIDLSDESASSDAANRFKTMGSGWVGLESQSFAFLLYDGTQSRWLVNPPGSREANQGDQESGTSTVRYVSPSKQHFHPGHPKVWAELLANSTTIEVDYNVDTSGDTATGAITPDFTVNFSGVDWACFVSRAEDDMTLVYSVTYDAKAAGSVILRSVVEAGSGSDPSAASGNATWSFCGLGDQA